MKNIGVLFGLMHIVVLVAGQALFPTIPDSLLKDVGRKNTICYQIINGSEESITFFPMASILQSGKYVTLSKDSLISWVVSEVQTKDTSEVGIEAVVALAKLLKSPMHLNGLNMFSHSSPGVARKKFSLNGWFGNYYAQCGDFAVMGNEILMATGLIDSSELRFVTTDRHSVSELLYHGRWVKFDYDPSTPSLLTPNIDSPNGWASVNDIFENTSLLSVKNQYLYDDTLNICPPWSTIQEYQEMFKGSPPKYSEVRPIDPLNLDGLWALCAKCTLEFDLPTISQENRFRFWPVRKKCKITGNNDCPWVPTVTVRIPATSDTIQLGLDVRLPNIVTSVKTTGTVMLMDTVVYGAFDVNLWVDDPAGGTLSASNAQVNYLTEGWICSPFGETIIDVAFNPVVYPLGKETIEVDIRGQPRMLETRWFVTPRDRSFKYK